MRLCDLGRQRDTGLISFRAAQARIPKLYEQLHLLCAKSVPHPDAESFRLRLLDPKRDYHRLFTFLDINRMPQPTIMPSKHSGSPSSSARSSSETVLSKALTRSPSISQSCTPPTASISIPSLS